MGKMTRQGATPKGFERRIRDLRFERVNDPRYAPNVDYKLPVMLTVLVSAMVTAARSLRHVEQRTSQLLQRNGPWQGLESRIADNTFGKLIPRLKLEPLVKRLVGMVKAEHRRGNLAPTQLPVATAAIDGKNVATLHWHDLCRVLKLDPNMAKPNQVKGKLKKEYPNVQLCLPKDGKPYALARVHTVTSISSSAAACIYQRPIEGRTNEIGALPALLKELRAAYGRTDIVAMLTTDAGNTSLGTATKIVDELHWDYFSQFKSEQGELHNEAVRFLGRRRESTADESYVDTQNGYVVTYHVWHADLSEQGWLDWTHARQLVRVQRVAEHPTTGHKTIGNRYYVTSKTSSELKPKDALNISRGHWRCEEETHWTSDVVLQEDRRRLAWSRHPHGVFVVSALRMMALNILALARKLSRVHGTNETPTWQQVVEHFLLILCATTLLTEEFDEVSE
jgi:predicted transposase YbfD/YdcC